MTMCMDNGVGLRASARREELGLSQEDVARHCEVTQASISDLESGKTRRPRFLDDLAVILHTSTEWLKTGRGKLDGQGSKPTEHDHTKSEIVEVLGEEYAAVTRWDIRASAGGGSIIPDAPDALHRILFRMQWLRSMTRAPLEKVFAVEVEGDSMEPTLRQGDLVLVDTSRTDPGSDSIFLLDDGELKVKRVQRDPRNQLLVIRSDNPAYEDFRDVPPENVNIVGRVFWIGRHF